MTEVKLWNGKQVTEPGVYVGIDNSRYQRFDLTDGPSATSTLLRRIAPPFGSFDGYGKTPYHTWGHYFDPKRPRWSPEDEEPEHFRIGRAAHTLLLEPERFEVEFPTRPEIWDSWRKQAARDWRTAEQAKYHTVLDPSEREEVEGVAARLTDHHLHKDGILSGLVEASIIWKDQKTGLWLKSRPDAIPMHADGMIVDLKVCRSAYPPDVRRSIISLGYDMQVALAGIGMEVVLGRQTDTYAIVAVESKPPHAIHVATIGAKRIMLARLRLRKAIDLYATCLRTGDWPMYGNDGLEVGLTDWEDQQMAALQESGDLPKEF